MPATTNLLRTPGIDRAENDVIVAMLRHIGSGNVFAVSGGRVLQLDATTVELPVRHGYSVVVSYDRARDLYDVTRVLTRRPKAGPADWNPAPVRKVRGELFGLYADQVGDAAYRASCYSDPFGGES